MTAGQDDEYVRRLARRIYWLDRCRRPLAFVLAAIATTLLIRAIQHYLPENWPGAHMVAIGIVVALVTWYGTETLFNLVLSLWETDHAKRTAPAGLPRAQLTRRSARRNGRSARPRA